VELDFEAGMLEAHMMPSPQSEQSRFWHRLGPNAVLLRPSRGDSEEAVQEFAALQADRIAAVAPGDAPDAA